MSNEHEEKVAGVTLWHTRTVQGTTFQPGTYSMEVTLRAQVTDEEIWKIVEKKFQDGFRVFTGPDFHIEVMDVMRDEVKALEAELARVRRELIQEKDSKASIQRDLDRYRSSFVEFGRTLFNRPGA